MEASISLDFLLRLSLSAIAITVLIRVIISKENTRFLKHIATAFTIVVAAQLLVFIATVIKKNFVSLHPEVNPAELNVYISGINVSLSFLSTFFVLTAYYLTLVYPKQNIPDGVAAAAVGILAIIVAVVQLVVSIIPREAIIFTLEAIDALTSTLSLLALGVAFFKFPTVSQTQQTFAQLTSLFFGLCGIFQLFYWVFYDTKVHEVLTGAKLIPEDIRMFQVYLSVESFVAIMLLAMFSILSLPDKRN